MGDLDKMIERIMREQKRALPATTISALTGEPEFKIAKKLRKMEKNGIIKKRRSIKMGFYRLSDK